MEAIVLVGGLGTRLKGVLHGVPKPMAPIGGVPFLQRLLVCLRREGYHRIIFASGYLHDVIAGHFGRSFAGMEVDYSLEKTPLGTGGAVQLAAWKCTQGEVSILNGDTFVNVEHARMRAEHRARRSLFTIALRWVPDVSRYGEVNVHDGKVTRFCEKSLSGEGWINAGVYTADVGLLRNLHQKESFSMERDILPSLAQQQRLDAFFTSGYFIDIGIPEDLQRAQAEYPTW
jgi:D-glycero-alpha-D-manno-heptose 1-phosphate guanylyltransferase